MCNYVVRGGVLFKLFNCLKSLKTCLWFQLGLQYIDKIAVAYLTMVLSEPSPLCYGNRHCAKKNNIHQVTTMLATSKNIVFSGYNHMMQLFHWVIVSYVWSLELDYK